MNSSNHEKHCTQCNKLLPLSMYYRDRTAIIKEAYRSKCKSCCKENQNNRKKNKIDETITKKICNICNIDKPIIDFYKSYRHKDGFFKECGKCLDNKRLNPGNNQKIKRTKEYMIEYNKKRYSDFTFKLKHIMRSNLSKRLKLGIKTNPTLKYVGCSISFLIKWFEFLFDENMTLENHGKYWHIDHIIPCSHFDLENQDSIHKCYNWTNLRPCKAIENLYKGDKIDEELIEDYEILKDLFLTNNRYEVKENIYDVLLPVVKTHL